MSLRGSTSQNSAGKLEDVQAAAGCPAANSASTCAVSLCARLDCCEQVRTQVPQAMQRAGMTSAWPSMMRIAFAGHSRTLTCNTCGKLPHRRDKGFAACRDHHVLS